MLQLKGSIGVGGGHVVRTALSLAATTRRDVEIVDFTSRDAAPGLRPRHVSMINALASICAATVDGATVNSRSFTFRPGVVKAGDYAFEANARGAEPENATSILRSLLPPLLLAGGASTVQVHGITHGLDEATATAVQTVLAPAIRKFGFRGDIGVTRWGFGPTGIGSIAARIEPVPVLRGVDFSERGPLIQIGGIATAVGQDGQVDRLRNRAMRRMGEVGRSATIQVQTVPAEGEGKFIYLLAVFERTIAGFAGVGQPTESAEETADRAVDALLAYLASFMSLEHTVADDLLVYAALAEGASLLATDLISNRTMTTIEILKRFIPVKVEISGRPGGPGEMRVTGIGLRS